MRAVVALLLLAGCATAPAVVAPPLRTSPARVFKLADPGREGTESCTFTVVLPEGAVPVSAEIVTLAGARELERRTTAITGPGVRVQVRRPRNDAFDRVRGTVRLASGAAAPFDVPVGTYTPKTKLIFPFRGPGIITAGGVNDGGHRNASGQFAVDALALSETYAPMTCTEDRNECTPGFGRREIVAPAGGTIIEVWNDIPDNPSWETADRTLFTRPDGTVVDTGNSVVIDHGNGEYSMIAHMQQGSIVVTKGQQVRQGDKIGLLGNSGESYGPHVHYQLQDGPDRHTASGLPVVFEKGPGRVVRGSYFNAK